MYAMATGVKTADTMTCAEIFTEIIKRQITGVMYHDQMCSYYRFLDLKCFAEKHKKAFMCECAKMRETKDHYITHHNMVLIESGAEDPQAIPQEWVKYKRSDVTASVKQKAVKDALETSKKWEEETKEHLCMYHKALMSRGAITDAKYVACMIKDVEKEIRHYNELMIRLGTLSYDMMYIVEMQH